MQPEGSIFYQDEYGVLYRSEWTIVNNQLDITSIVSSPFVPGQADNGYVQNNNTYRRGTITTTRQIFKILNNGYQLIAEGRNTEIDYIQTTFNCSTKPKDTFKHHLNNLQSSDVVMHVSEGPRWGDVDDEGAVWAEVEADGTIGVSTGDAEVLQFIDVW
jgi:hypothetical protein